MSDMIKPITVARQDLLEAIVRDINKSNLPAFAVSEILGSVKASTDQLAREQYEKDLAAYRQRIEQQELMGDLPAAHQPMPGRRRAKGGR